MSEGNIVKVVRCFQTGKRLCESAGNTVLVSVSLTNIIILGAFHISGSRLAGATMGLWEMDKLEDIPIVKFFRLIHRLRLPQIVVHRYLQHRPVSKEILKERIAYLPVYRVIQFQAACMFCHMHENGGTLEDITLMLRIAMTADDNEFTLGPFSLTLGQNIFILMNALLSVSSETDEENAEAEAKGEEGSSPSTPGPDSDSKEQEGGVSARGAGEGLNISGESQAAPLSKEEARVALRSLLSRIANHCCNMAPAQSSVSLKCSLYTLLIEETLYPEELATGTRGPKKLRMLLDVQARTPSAWISEGEEGFLRFINVAVDYHVARLTQGPESPAATAALESAVRMSEKRIRDAIMLCEASPRLKQNISGHGVGDTAAKVQEMAQVVAADVDIGEMHQWGPDAEFLSAYCGRHPKVALGRADGELMKVPPARGSFGCFGVPL